MVCHYQYFFQPYLRAPSYTTFHAQLHLHSFEIPSQDKYHMSKLSALVSHFGPPPNTLVKTSLISSLWMETSAAFFLTLASGCVVSYLELNLPLVVADASFVVVLWLDSCYSFSS